MLSKEWYKDWFSSPYYHQLYMDRDKKEAKAFIERILNRFQLAAGSRLLDVGCGRGRYSRMLAEKGFEVTGIDLSFESIAYAKQYESDHLFFYQHDMRLPFWINYFDFAFNFFTSFGYFHTRREHDDAMRTIASSLKPTGMVMIDYLNIHYTEEKLVGDEIKQINGTEYHINRWQDQDHFYKKIVIHDKALDKPKEYTEKVAKFSLGDFTDMLSFQNMQVTEVFGDYALNPYNVNTTPRMILVAKKNK